MSNQTPHYKIVCPPLDTVILVKKLNVKEERELYHALRDRISEVESPLNMESYMDFLCKALVLEFDKIIEHFVEDDEEDVVKAVYMCVVQSYPMFRLETICDDLNTSLMMKGMGGFLEDLLQQYKMTKWTEQVDEDKLKPQPLKFSSLEDLNKIHRFLKKNIIGQDEAILSVFESLKLVAAGMSSFGSFFFIGPTGVGKTQLGRFLGQKFSGNFYKINCAEYSSGHEYSKLIGSPPGYIGHTDQSVLAEKSAKSNRWVFLFDEIEKAHEKFQDFLLSLLDDGTVTDNMGRLLDFSESIFIFTSNQGVRDSKVGEETLGFGGHQRTYAESQEEILKSVKKKFSPEFLNRIDNFIFFNSLTTENVAKIVELELKDLPIKKTKRLVAYITENAYSEEYGARNVARFIKNNVATKLADEILNKRVPEKSGDYYTPKIKNGQLEIVKTIKFEGIKNGIHDKETSASSY